MEKFNSFQVAQIKAMSKLIGEKFPKQELNPTAHSHSGRLNLVAKAHGYANFQNLTHAAKVAQFDGEFTAGLNQKEILALFSKVLGLDCGEFLRKNSSLLRTDSILLTNKFTYEMNEDIKITFFQSNFGSWMYTMNDDFKYPREFPAIHILMGEVSEISKVEKNSSGIAVYFEGIEDPLRVFNTLNGNTFWSHFGISFRQHKMQININDLSGFLNGHGYEKVPELATDLLNYSIVFSDDEESVSLYLGVKGHIGWVVLKSDGTIVQSPDIPSEICQLHEVLPWLSKSSHVDQAWLSEFDFSVDVEDSAASIEIGACYMAYIAQATVKGYPKPRFADFVKLAKRHIISEFKLVQQEIRDNLAIEQFCEAGEIPFERI